MTRTSFAHIAKLSLQMNGRLRLAIAHAAAYRECVHDCGDVDQLTVQGGVHREFARRLK